MAEEEKMIICSRCGAEIKESQAYCNYCGSINILGAEVDYFNKLEGVRKNLEELGDDSEEEYKKTFKKTGKLIAVSLIVAAVVALIVVGIVFLKKRADQKRYSYSYNEKMKVFAYLDELYESEKYDEIVAYYEENAKNNYQIYEWQHDDFRWLYDYHTWVVRDAARYEKDVDEKNGKEKEDMSWLIMDAVKLNYQYNLYSINDSLIYDFNEDEAGRIKKLLDEDKATVIKIADISEETFDKIVKDYGDAYKAEEYWDINKTREYLTTIGLY